MALRSITVFLSTLVGGGYAQTCSKQGFYTCAGAGGNIPVSQVCNGVNNCGSNSPVVINMNGQVNVADDELDCGGACLSVVVRSFLRMYGSGMAKYVANCAGLADQIVGGAVTGITMNSQGNAYSISGINQEIETGSVR